MVLPRLKALRHELGMTQEQVADYLIMQREVYRRYEKGLYDIPLWALVKLARLYGCSVDYLMGLSDKR